MSSHVADSDLRIPHHLLEELWKACTRSPAIPRKKAQNTKLTWPVIEMVLSQTSGALRFQNRGQWIKHIYDLKWPFFATLVDMRKLPNSQRSLEDPLCGWGSKWYSSFDDYKTRKGSLKSLLSRLPSPEAFKVRGTTLMILLLIQSFRVTTPDGGFELVFSLDGASKGRTEARKRLDQALADPTTLGVAVYACKWFETGYPVRDAQGSFAVFAPDGSPARALLVGEEMDRFARATSDAPLTRVGGVEALSLMHVSENEDDPESVEGESEGTSLSVVGNANMLDTESDGDIGLPPLTPGLNSPMPIDTHWSMDMGSSMGSSSPGPMPSQYEDSSFLSH